MQNTKGSLVFDFNLKTNAKFGPEKALHLGAIFKGTLALETRYHH